MNVPAAPLVRDDCLNGVGHVVYIFVVYVFQEMLLAREACEFDRFCGFLRLSRKLAGSAAENTSVQLS